MKSTITKVLVTVIFYFCFQDLPAQSTQLSTYCNPLNVDYTYTIYNAHRDISYRSGADPAVVRFNLYGKLPGLYYRLMDKNG